MTSVLNRADKIVRCLDSVQKQTGDYEIVHLIKDGGSMDGTVSVVNQYKKKNNIIREIIVIEKKDFSLYEGLNHCLDEVKGYDFACFLHSDDYFNFPKSIDLAVKEFLQYKCDIVYAGILLSKAGKILKEWQPGIQHYNKFKFGWTIPHTGMFYKASCLINAGKFVESYKISSDYDYLIRLSKASLSWQRLLLPLVIQDLTGASNHGLKAQFVKFNEDRKILAKHRFHFPLLVAILKRILKLIHWKKFIFRKV